MMEYKGYKGQVVYDDEAKIFHGEVFGIRDVVTFQGTCVADLEQAFKDSIDDYLDFCQSRGEQSEKPFSGKFNLRLQPELHMQVALRAKEENKSMNEWITETLSLAMKEPINH